MTEESASAKAPSRIRRRAITLAVLLALFLLLMFTWAPGFVMSSRNQVLYPGPYTVDLEAGKLHKELFVADLHCDALLWNRDILVRSARGHVDLPRLAEGNVALQVFTAASKIPAGMNIDANDDGLDLLVPLVFFQGWPARTWFSPLYRALYQGSRLERAARQSSGALVILRTREDLARFVERRTREPHLVGAVLGIEGLHCLEGSLENVRQLWHAGFRTMGPAHFFDNDVGGSAHGVEKGGLTEFGRKVIRFMEELKILVDLAHASSAVIDDVLAMSTRPVIVSHTGVRGTCDNNRNLTDDQIRGIAATGGLIGVGFWDTAVCAAEVDNIVAAMKYTAELVGADHVALGSDFDGATTVPFDASGMALLTEGLLKAGLSTEDVGKIMGGNILRVLLASLPAAADSPDLAGKDLF